VTNPIKVMLRARRLLGWLRKALNALHAVGVIESRGPSAAAIFAEELKRGDDDA